MIFKNNKFEETIRVGGLEETIMMGGLVGGLGKRNFNKGPFLSTDGRTPARVPSYKLIPSLRLW